MVSFTRIAIPARVNAMDKGFTVREGFKVRFFHYLEAIERRVHIAPHVTSVGYLLDKHKWERGYFKHSAFSFILEGRGEYRRFGKIWQVEAPCVLTQWGGDEIEYGPHDTWRELFVSYRGGAIDQLITGDYLDSDRPTWAVAQPETHRGNVNELLYLLNTYSLDEAVDAIDIQCLKLITDSMCRRAPHSKSPEEAAITRIQRAIDNDFSINWETREMARQANMSKSTFRRHWMKIVGVSPQQYIIERKLETACQLLQNPALRVADVASILHFDDYFYFARLFKKKMGMSASEYRGGMPSSKR